MKTSVYLFSSTALLAALLPTGGCHYYVSAVPRVIISSEPFVVPNPTPPPPQPAFQLGPD